MTTTKRKRKAAEPKLPLQCYEGYCGAWDKEGAKCFIYRVTTDGDLQYHVPMARIYETREGRWLPHIYVHGVMYPGGIGTSPLEKVRGNIEAALHAHWAKVAELV